MHRTYSKKKFEKNGFSIIEVIIAVAIIGAIIGVASYFMTSNKSASKRLEDSATCQQVVTSILQDFTNEDNALLVRNELVTPDLSAFKGRTGRDFIDAGRYFNFQNIESASTRLYQIYRFNSAICGTGVSLKTQSSTLKNVTWLDDPKIVDATILITPTDTIAGAPLTCADIENLQIPNISGSNTPVTFKIKVTAQIQEAGGTKTCETEGAVAFQRDSTVPSVGLTSIEGFLGGTWNPAVNPLNTICNTGQVRVTTTSTEAGSVFICSLNTAGPYEACQGFKPDTAQAVTGQVSLATSSATENAPVSAFIDFTGLAEKRYTFYIKTVDTAANISTTTSTADFIVDLRRPTWVDTLTSVNDPAPQVGREKVVDTASARPRDSAFATDAHAASSGFGTNLYQCSLGSSPRFQGQIDAPVMGNETCTATTTSTIAANRKTGAAVTSTISGDLCTIILSATPAFAPGDISLTGTLTDPCYPSPDPVLPVEATAGPVTWTIDPVPGLGGVAIDSTHVPSPVRSVPLSPTAQTPSQIAWNIGFDRSHAALNLTPLVYEYKDVVTAGSEYGVVSNASTPNGLTAAAQDWASYTPSCIYGHGFCARAWGPCGQNDTSRNVAGGIGPTAHVAIMGDNGDSCWQVPCRSGLSCYHDGRCRTTNLATTVWKCTNHSDCYPGANECSVGAWGTDPNAGLCEMGKYRLCTLSSECVLANNDRGRCNFVGSPVSGMGYCDYPDNNPIGYIPGVQTNRDSTCPNDSWGQTVCGGTNQTCECELNNGLCWYQSYPNKAPCNWANACRGRSADPSCSLVNVVNPIVPNCAWQATSGWLGATVGENITNLIPGPWGSGGVPYPAPAQPYLVECALPSAPTVFNATNCVYSNWSESPQRPASPNLAYRIKVIDSRGDYELADCTYKLDRTAPSLTGSQIQAPACGAVNRPTLSNSVPIQFTTSDGHSDPLIVLTNSDIPSLPQTSCSNCSVLSGNVKGSSSRTSNTMRLTSTDAAGNYSTSTVDVYVGVNSGMTLSVSDGSPSYTQKGCRACSTSPQNLDISATISGANSNNFDSSMTVLRSISGEGTTSVARSANQLVDFASDGQPTLGYGFRDACNTTSTYANRLMKLDWTPPSFGACVPQGTDGLRFSSWDNGVGLNNFSVSCFPSGSGSSGGGNITLSPLAAGTYNCDLSAVDDLGNAGTTSKTCDVVAAVPGCSGAYPFDSLSECRNNSVCNEGGNCQSSSGCYRCVPDAPCVPDCSAAGAWCEGSSFSDGCGGECQGTKTSGSGNGCFTAGTLVETPTGAKPIQDLKKGDKIYSYDLEIQKIVIGTVTNTFVHFNKEINKLKLSSGREFEVTDEHPFYVPDLGTWKNVADLKVGDQLLDVSSSSKIVTITSLKKTGASDTVYNIEVDEYSNYFVDGVLVHNKPCNCIDTGDICQFTTWKCGHMGSGPPGGVNHCGSCCNQPNSFNFECGATGGTDCNLCQGLGVKSCR